MENLSPSWLAQADNGDLLNHWGLIANHNLFSVGCKQQNPPEISSDKDHLVNVRLMLEKIWKVVRLIVRQVSESLKATKHGRCQHTNAEHRM